MGKAAPDRGRGTSPPPPPAPRPASPAAQTSRPPPPHPQAGAAAREGPCAPLCCGRERARKRETETRARPHARTCAGPSESNVSIIYLFICLSILLSNLSIQKSIHPSISWIRAPALVPAPRKAGTPPASAPPRAAASPAAAIHASRRPVAAQRGIGVYGTWKRQVRSCAVNRMVESEEKIDGQFRILKRSPPLDAFDVSCF